MSQCTGPVTFAKARTSKRSRMNHSASINKLIGHKKLFRGFTKIFAKQSDVN